MKTKTHKLIRYLYVTLQQNLSVQASSGIGTLSATGWGVVGGGRGGRRPSALGGVGWGVGADKAVLKLATHLGYGP